MDLHTCHKLPQCALPTFCSKSAHIQYRVILTSSVSNYIPQHGSLSVLSELSEHFWTTQHCESLYHTHGFLLLFSPRALLQKARWKILFPETHQSICEKNVQLGFHTRKSIWIETNGLKMKLKVRQQLQMFFFNFMVKVVSIPWCILLENNRFNLIIHLHANEDSPTKYCDNMKITNHRRHWQRPY